MVAFMGEDQPTSDATERHTGEDAELERASAHPPDSPPTPAPTATLPSPVPIPSRAPTRAGASALARVFGAPGGVMRSFLPSAAPVMSRRNYRWELRGALMIPAAVACVEGNVVGVIAKKEFVGPTGADNASALNYVVAALAAAGPLAMLTSVVWTRVFHGRDRVRCANALQVGLIACVLGLALAPFNALGIVMFVAFTLAARSLATGIVTARADIWRANYARSARARMTGKLTIVTTLVVSVTSLVIAASMDVEALRWP